MGAQDAYAYAEVNVGMVSTPDSAARAYAEVNVGMVKAPVSTGYAYAEVDVLLATDEPTPTGFKNVAVASSSATSATAASPASNLFDLTSATYYEAAATGNVTVTAVLAAPTKVDQYVITARSDKPTAAPAAWTFQGSADGNTWTVLDTQAGQSFAAGQSKTYPKTDPTAYAQYRIAVTANGNAAYATSFSDLQFQAQSGPTFSIGIKLFGVTYNAGDVVPTSWPAKLLTSLTRRGRVKPPGPTVRKNSKIDGTTYAAGAAFTGTTSGTALRRILRGKIIK